MVAHDDCRRIGICGKVLFAAFFHIDKQKKHEQFCPDGCEEKIKAVAIALGCGEKCQWDAQEREEKRDTKPRTQSDGGFDVIERLQEMPTTS